MSIKEFNSFADKTKVVTEDDFLKEYWTTENGNNGWKYKGKFTTDIETAKKWFNAKK